MTSVSFHMTDCLALYQKWWRLSRKKSGSIEALRNSGCFGLYHLQFIWMVPRLLFELAGIRTGYWHNPHLSPRHLLYWFMHTDAWKIWKHSKPFSDKLLFKIISQFVNVFLLFGCIMWLLKKLFDFVYPKWQVQSRKLLKIALLSHY